MMRLCPDRRDLLGRAELRERVQRGLDHVEPVLGAERLADGVADADGLEDGAHAAADDEPLAVRGRLEDHAAAVADAFDVVRNRLALEDDLAHVLAGRLAALADRVRDLVGLAEAEPDPAVLVADDDDRREAHAATALDGLRAAVDEDGVLVERVLRLVLTTLVTVECHGYLSSFLALIDRPASTAASI